MKLTVREAATILGRSARTLRGQITRGEVTAVKKGSRWLLDSAVLPMTEAQRRALQARADEVRAAVEGALPPRTARTRGQGGYSVSSLDALRAIQSLLADMRPHDGGGAAAARRRLRAALLDLCDGAHQYDRQVKVPLLIRARAGASRALGHLLLEADGVPPEPMLGWVVRLEGDVLPGIAGLLRRAERLPEGHRR